MQVSIALGMSNFKLKNVKVKNEIRIVFDHRPPSD